ncbi:5-hydroxyisourate hydrolase [Sediminihabitans luteus]|uniref:5-hydroxyisourate hydrolase n=1 Tax=Sediminihabitans luteus TaxID=1138585 RepID=A0A2M9CYE3_9CELL|nr:hydroxyisourate hydrolase [Sediminihabitans luteus]PJJ76956.1 5-hydroxyisourate hydrolase [Sediminihabitans luteus]GII99597.1 5-hydroxyisourate hydrolase [Sediminihabitans luteus]
MSGATTSGATTSHLTTHVLDTATGTPAVGVEVVLERVGTPTPVATGTTDADGRVTRLGPDVLEPGTYLLRFATGAWYAASDTPTIFPEVCVTLTLDDPARHYHVPLLLSPFAYSTYRGS